jgi:hypothetical protein
MLRSWWRITGLAISLAASIATLRIAGVETSALAGPVWTAVPNQVDNLLLLAKDKPKQGCSLCNNKGYCLDEVNQQQCQSEKSIVELNWGPGYKWKCRCSKKPLASKERACCWPADVPSAKFCADAVSARSLAVTRFPGKVIECGPNKP